MNISEVAKGIYRLSINVENILFEGLWEIPNGVSLNSYIVKGEKTAIIDGVCGWDETPEALFALLDQMDIKVEDIDYLVVNHTEPDHSGWIESFREISSDFEIICSKNASNFLSAFYNQTENVRIVNDGDILDLGNGKQLSFVEIPNLHWPDTMATFDNETGTLMSCDAFGSYGRVSERNYDDLLSEEEITFFLQEAVRYYANIVAIFSQQVLKALDKCAQLPIKIVAPGHGIVWRKNPNRIIEHYRTLANYQKGPAKKEVTLLFGSMYGMTEAAVEYAKQLLDEKGVTYRTYRLPDTDIGTVLASAWESQGIIVATPTYEFKMFPPVAEAIDELGRKKLPTEKRLCLGLMVGQREQKKELDEMLERYKLNWDLLDFVEFNGSAKAEDLNKIQIAIDTLVNSLED